MGFLQKQVSFTTYKIESPFEIDIGQIIKGLEKGRISEIDVSQGKDRTVGFAVFGNPLDVEFTEEKVVFETLILFSFRQDKLTIPSSTLKLYYQQKVKEKMIATRRERLRREEMDEIKEKVRIDLLRRALPSINAFDCVLDVRNRTLRIFTTNRSILDEFSTMAKEFLGLEIFEDNMVRVMEDNFSQEDMDRILRLKEDTIIIERWEDEQ